MHASIPVPLARLQIGQVLPVDIWTPDGRLLLRRGQRLDSEAHRDMLGTHHARVTETDAHAWQRSLERTLRTLRARGVPLEQLARVPMPATILDIDYLENHDVNGDWLDVQEILRGLLYQGHEASHPLARLQGIEHKVYTLLHRDPDDSLFVLIQALPDLSLGYCATHALLTAVIATLTAERLGDDDTQHMTLLRAALMMNIGMARPQDHLARQSRPPDAGQREIIASHPPASKDILARFGVDDEAVLATIEHHHTPQQARPALPPSLHTGLQVLNFADTLVAKMAPRTSRAAMVPLGAAKSLLLGSPPEHAAQAQAMASVLGFYPPGSYVQLANGEIGVVIQRGSRATTPHVAALFNAQGIALGSYAYRDTGHPDLPHCAVRRPVPQSEVKVQINLEKIRRLRAHLAG